MDGYYRLIGTWNELVRSEGSSVESQGVIKLLSTFSHLSTWGMQVACDNKDFIGAHFLVSREFNAPFLRVANPSRFTIDNRDIDANFPEHINSENAVFNGNFNQAAMPGAMFWRLMPDRLLGGYGFALLAESPRAMKLIFDFMQENGVIEHNDIAKIYLKLLENRKYKAQEMRNGAHQSDESKADNRVTDMLIELMREDLKAVVVESTELREPLRITSGRVIG